MKFLQFLLPRFGLLGVLCLGLWLSSTLLARYSVNQSQRQLSHAVATDEVEFDLSQPSLQLNSVTVGDPQQDPMYLEMDKVTLRLDPKAIVSRRLVVRDGVITNLHLVDSRLESHNESKQSQRESAFSGTAEVVRETLSDKLHSAIRQARPRDWQYGSSPLAGNTQLADNTWWSNVVRSLEADAREHEPLEASFKDRWQTPIEQARQQVKQLKAEIERLQQQAQKPVNPLRAHGMTIETQQKITQLTTQLTDVQSDVQQLRADAIAELASHREITTDQAKARLAQMGIPQPNAQLISHQMVAQQDLEQVQSMLKWVDWAGNLVPNLEWNGQQRGRDVSFGQSHRPSLQVDQLTLVGVTDVGGNYFRFMGRLNNFTNQPDQQSEPTSLSLRAQGTQHVIVNALYDHRGDEEKTFISVKTPDLLQRETELPAGSIENSLGLALQVSPTTAYSQISLTLEGSRVTGQVVIRHNNAKIQLAQSQIGDTTLAGLINYELSGCESYQTVYDLEGTVDHIVATPECDLGTHVAAALDSATRSHVQKLVDLETAQRQAIADRQIQELDQWLKVATNDVFADIQSGRTEIARVQGTMEQKGQAPLRLR